MSGSSDNAAPERPLQRGQGPIRNILTKKSVSVKRSMPNDVDLLGRLMHLAKGFFRLYDKNRNLYRALLRRTIFEPTNETPIMSKRSEEYIQFLSRLLSEEKARGSIRAEVDTTVAAASIFSLYFGALVALFRMPGMTVETVADRLALMTDQCLKGIITNGR